MYYKVKFNHDYEFILTPESLFQIIDSYFSLPLSTLQYVANIREKNSGGNETEKDENNNNNSSAAIPEDCFEQHVMPFLTTKHFYLYGVPDDEFAEMQENVLKYTAPGLFGKKK